MKASVVLITKRSDPKIDVAIKFLNRQTCLDFEYIIVDGYYFQRKDEMLKLIEEQKPLFPVQYLPDKPCIPPGCDVITIDGTKDISNIAKTDKVMAHDGLLHNVSETYSRNYDGELVEITPSNFNIPVKLTPEHPILAVHHIKCNKSPSAICKPKPNTSCDYCRKYQEYSPDWIPAGQLNEGDLVLYPILKGEESNVIDLSHLGVIDGAKVYYKGRFPNETKHPSAHSIPHRINAGEELLRICGYFAAEGSIRKYTIRFHFGSDETDLVADTRHLMMKIFGLASKVRSEGRGKRGVVIEICSRLLSKLFTQWFGPSSSMRKVPSWLMGLPIALQKDFIRSLWCGVGSINKVNHKAYYSTASKTLAFQLAQLLLRQSIIPSFALIEKEGGYGRQKIWSFSLNGRSFDRFAEVMGLDVTKRRRAHGKGVIYQGYAWLAIRKIKRIQYRGPVHNLRVEQAQSYVCESLVAHNCRWRGRRPALSSARNTAIIWAKSQYMIFFDDCCIKVPEDLVENHLKWLTEGFAVAGNWFTHPGETYGFEHRAKIVKEAKIVSGDWLYGGHMSFPLQWTLAVNGFDENYDGEQGCDDCDHGIRLHRAGCKVLYDPSIYVEYDLRTHTLTQQDHGFKMEWRKEGKPVEPKKRILKDWKEHFSNEFLIQELAGDSKRILPTGNNFQLSKLRRLPAKFNYDVLAVHKELEKYVFQDNRDWRDGALIEEMLKE